MSVVEERRKIQRDWAGHVVQGFGIVVALMVGLGVPMAFWGMSMNTAVGKLEQRVDRQDRDITEGKQTQTLVTGQVLEVSKQLARIDTLLGDIREQFKPKR